jgi:hypothetical protein
VFSKDASVVLVKALGGGWTCPAYRRLAQLGSETIDPGAMGSHWIGKDGRNKDDKSEYSQSRNPERRRQKVAPALVDGFSAVRHAPEGFLVCSGDNELSIGYERESNRTEVCKRTVLFPYQNCQHSGKGDFIISRLVVHRLGPIRFRYAHGAIHHCLHRLANIRDPALGGVLWLCLNLPLLLGCLLCNRRLRRCRSTADVADLGSSGRHHGRADVWVVGELPVRYRDQASRASGRWVYYRFKDTENPLFKNIRCWIETVCCCDDIQRTCDGSGPV